MSWWHHLREIGQANRLLLPKGVRLSPPPMMQETLFYTPWPKCGKPCRMPAHCRLWKCGKTTRPWKQRCIGNWLRQHKL
eukprot:6639317-Prorocentrum_lima.AAC.1